MKAKRCLCTQMAHYNISDHPKTASHKFKIHKYASRYVATASLQLVEKVVEWWDALLETFAFSRIVDDSCWFGRWLKWVSGQDLPVVEDTLRECLATGIRTQISSETYNMHNH